jgi:hypothetical protein
MARAEISPTPTLKNLRLKAALEDVFDVPEDKSNRLVNEFEPITAYAAKRAGIVLNISRESRASYW